MPYDVDSPLAWVGSDRLVLKDRTRYGLHRRVVVRKGDMPDVYGWLTACMNEAGGADVHHWLVEQGEFYVLWIVWKDGRNEK